MTNVRQDRDNAVWQTLVCVAMGDQRLEEFARQHARVENRSLLLIEAMRMDLAAALVSAATQVAQESMYPPRIRAQMYDLLSASEFIKQTCVREATRIADTVEQRQIRAVFTKGIVLADSLYRPSAIRRFSDIDIMCHPDDAERLQRALVDLDYTPNVRYDRRTECLVQRSRQTLAKYRYSPDHLPHYHRLTKAAVPPVLMVDVALSLTWHHARTQVPPAELFDTPSSSSAALPTLDDAWHFLFLLTHFFREAWFYSAETQIRLPQLADVALYWQAMSVEDRRRFVERTVRHGATDLAIWSAIHVDSVFGTSVYESVGSGRPDDQTFARTVRRNHEQYGTWEGDILDRLGAGASLQLTAAAPPHARSI